VEDELQQNEQQKELMKKAARDWTHETKDAQAAEAVRLKKRREELEERMFATCSAIVAVPTF